MNSKSLSHIATIIKYYKHLSLESTKCKIHTSHMITTTGISDILVTKIILVLVLGSFQRNHFYFI